jgi:subtilisin family serine protease
MDADGHATHVTGIAAGSKIKENNYYGVAPDAEIIMISSNFDDAEIVEDVKYIKEFAEAEGKPWVINMSFGGLMGPHDGTSSSDRAIEKLLGPGGLVAAAMGNEGESKVHASYTFTTDGETKYVLVDHNECYEGMAVLDLWGQAADARVHLSVKPFIYTASGQFDYKTTSYWNNLSYTSGEINPYNKKEHYEFRVMVDNISSGTFGLAITGDAGQTFHIWANPNYGGFKQPVGINKSKFIPGDCKYSVSEGGATIPSAIAVGSYNSASTWYSEASKATVGINAGNLNKVGEISYFSNSGPSLDGGEKPTVVAPGAMIRAAYNQHSKSFNGNVEQDDYTTDKITVKVPHPAIPTLTTNEYYYYGLMQGTSMSTPVVTGTIALWLEANPELSPKDIENIFKETARKDGATGFTATNEKRGYGKIDAYEGLKKAIQYTEVGVNDVFNSETPITLLKQADEWRVLFGSNESYADLAVYTTSGRQVLSQHIKDIRRGDEATVSLSGLAPGVYVIKINTTANSTTRKVVVK